MNARFVIAVALLAWNSMLLGQQTAVRIEAIVPETMEPSPTTRVEPGRFLISRQSGTSLDAITVHLEYSGTATPGQDYAALPATVTLPMGALAHTLLVEPMDDDQIEGDETVIATLVAVPGTVPEIVPDQQQARVVIHDNDFDHELPEVRVSAPSWRTSEPCPVCFVAPGVLLFERSGSIELPLTVFLNTDGTATAGLDYEPLPSHIEIPAGQSAVEHLLFARDDLLVEGPEVVRVRLAPPPPDAGPYQIASQETALIVIGDDEPDAPQARLDFIMPKDGDRFSVARPIEVTVVGVWNQGEIDQGVEFFAGEELIGKTLPLPTARPPIPGLPSVHTIVWEHAPLGAHTLAAKTPLDSENSLSAPPIQIVVSDELPPGTVRIEATQRIAEETSAPLRRLRFNGLFTISRTGSIDHDQSVWVRYSGSSTRGLDYSPLPWLVTIPAGARSVEIAVEAIPDEIPEAIETLVATVSRCPPPPLRGPCYEFSIDPTGEHATVFLRDDGITQATLEMVQPRDGARFEPGQSIPIEVVAIDLEGYISTVSFYANAELLTTLTIHFLVAPPPGTPVHFDFEWRDALPGDYVLSARAHLAGSAPVHISVGPPMTERVVLEILAADSFAMEPGPEHPADPGRLTIRRSAGPLDVAVAAFYQLFGTAENGVDYELLSREVLLPAGARSVDIPIVPLADELSEGEETVLAVLIPIPCVNPPPPSCYLIGPMDEARVTIADSSSQDRPPNAIITHPAQGQEFDPGSPIPIRVQAVDPDGYVRRIVYLVDGLQIGEETLDFIQPPEPGQTQIFEFVWNEPMPGPHRVTARVTDNEGLHGAAPPVEILVRAAETAPAIAVLVLDGFAREPGAAAEANTAAFGIVRFGSSAEALEIGYSMLGQARNGLDYVELSGRVVIAPGHETAIVTVAPLPDEEREGIETVRLSLNASAHYTLVPDHRQATAVIADRELIHPRPRCIAFSDGSHYLCFPIPAGSRFRMETSTDLRAWRTLMHGSASEDGAHYVDEPASDPHRFYRLVPDEQGAGEEAIIRLELEREMQSGAGTTTPPLPPTPIQPAGE